jgi:hypothetical protein
MIILLWRGSKGYHKPNPYASVGSKIGKSIWRYGRPPAPAQAQAAFRRRPLLHSFDADPGVAYETNGHGGFRDPPGKSKGVRFEVYQGEGLRFGRDLHAEQVAVEALRTLIRYSRLAATHRTTNAPGALAVR